MYKCGDPEAQIYFYVVYIIWLRFGSAQSSLAVVSIDFPPPHDPRW
jgi:hypothetical protein